MMPPRNPEITWTLQLDEVQFVLATLGKLPLEQVAPLHEKLRSQAQAQLQAMQSAVEGEIMPPSQRVRPNGTTEQQRAT
jgi:hypothetical protein